MYSRSATKKKTTVEKHNKYEYANNKINKYT